MHNKQIKVNKHNQKNQGNNKSFSINKINYRYNEDDKLEEVNNYGGNNYVFYSNNCSRKGDNKSSSSRNTKYIYQIMDNSSKKNRLNNIINRSWQFEPNKLYGQQKGGLESKIENLINNISKLTNKIDIERIESKKQIADLINELRAERELSKINLNRFMDEMKKERNAFIDEMKKERSAFIDEMKKERIQSNKEYNEILDVLKKALNKNK